MDTNRIASILRYLVSPEDTILSGPNTNPGGFLQVLKSLVCVIGATGLMLVLSTLR